MIGGVNFQPGQMQGGGMQPKPKQGNSVQEAIKILSLRLPKQVGPNALAPAALLNAQGSGGNPRIDSVVNTVMSRMFPTGDAPSGAAPVLGPSPGANTTMPVSPPARFDPAVAPSRPSETTPLSSLMAPQAPTPIATPAPTQAPPPVAFDGATRPPDTMSLAALMPPPDPGPSARAPRISPMEERPIEVQATPAPEMAPEGPGERIDVTPPAQPSDPVGQAPTQDPWADLMEYLRRNIYEPAPPQETPSI